MDADADSADDADDLLEPHPDIYALFQHYAPLYFGDALGRASVEWSSKRMTLCAGVCEWRPAEGRVVVKLSEPLLKYRPGRDLKDVLLHELIHARMFLDGTWKADGDHGPGFRAHARAINEATCPDHQVMVVGRWALRVVGKGGEGRQGFFQGLLIRKHACRPSAHPSTNPPQTAAPHNTTHSAPRAATV